MTEPLPAGWAQATVEALAAPEQRAITDGPFGSNLKTAHYTTEGPRVVRLQNIGEGAFLDDRAYISRTHYESLMRHNVLAGDVLVAALGAVLPRACVAPEWLGDAIVKADCLRFRLHPDIDPRYVAAILNSPPTRARTAAGITGVGRPRLNLAKTRSLHIPLPPRAEQKRIVAAIEEQLSRLDDAVQNLTSAKKSVASLRAAVLTDAFAGRLVPQDAADEPAQLLIERCDHVRRTFLGRRYTPPLVPATDDMYPLPAGWQWIALEAITAITGGVTKDAKRQSDPAFVEAPYLRVANVQRGYLDLDQVTTIRVPPEKLTALRLQRGDVLFTEGGDRDKLGRGWVWEGRIENCIHQNHVFRARPLDQGIQSKFLSWHGNFFGRWWFEAHGKQTTNLASINMTTLRSLPVPLPPAKEQARIVAEVERQFSILDALYRTVETALPRAASLRSSLLAAAFHGELVRQDPSDEPATALLARIESSRSNLPSRPRRQGA